MEDYTGCLLVKCCFQIFAIFQFFCRYSEKAEQGKNQNNPDGSSKPPSSAPPDDSSPKSPPGSSDDPSDSPKDPQDLSQLPGWQRYAAGRAIPRYPPVDETPEQKAYRLSVLPHGKILMFFLLASYAFATFWFFYQVYKENRQKENR